MREPRVQAEPLAATASARLGRLREAAAREGLGALVCTHPDNVYYLSGFRTSIHTRFMAAILSVENPSPPCLVLPVVEERLAREPIWSPTWFEDVRAFQGGSSPKAGAPADPETILREILGGLGPIGADLDHMPYSAYGVLRRSLDGGEPMNFSPDLLRLRIIKDEAERARMAEAGRLACEGARRLGEMLHPGVTELALARTIEGEALEGGADGFAYPTLVSFGLKSLAAHSPPMNRPLEAGQIVTLAFGPQVEGYSSDLVRTFFLGEPPMEVLERAAQATEAQEETLGAVRAGAAGGHLMARALACFRAHFSQIPDNGRAGHGLGLSVHEPPPLSLSDQTPLAPGMVLAIEPAAPAFHMEAHGRYRHCDVVEVQELGSRLLTPHPRGLLVAD